MIKIPPDKLHANLEAHVVTRDYMVSGETFRVCPHPEIEGLLFTSPAPELPEAYYESDAYLSHQDRPDTFFGQVYRLARTWNVGRKIRLISKYMPESGSLLEIGTGQGDFLRAARKKGWSVSGVEPNEGAAGRAREKGLEIYSSLEEVTTGPLDCIALWHVLEHIRDLSGTIERIRDDLRPGGYLILAVPNYRSLDSQYYNSYWAGYDVPRHLWHFSKPSVHALFKKYGFECIHTRGMWLDAFYVSWLSEKYRKNTWAPLSGFLMGLRSNIVACFSREHSSVIYILRKSGHRA